MTEEEWREQTNPFLMVDLVDRNASKRKQRLFACACFRQTWKTLDGEGEVIRWAVEVGEGLAEGIATPDEVDSLCRQLEPHLCKTRSGPTYGDIALTLVADDTSDFALYFIDCRPYLPVPGPGAALHCDLLRCVIGNPFRPVSLNPAWLTPTVTSLATVAYTERALPSGELDTARLAVLADALEEAGCTNADILGHLRSPGPHVRGCWVVDLLLGKE